MPLTCKCGATLNPETKPPTIVNTADASVVIVSNARVSCPNPACRAVYLQQIAEANIKFAWPMAAPERKSSGLVVPSGPLSPAMRKLIQG